MMWSQNFARAARRAPGSPRARSGRQLLDLGEQSERAL